MYSLHGLPSHTLPQETLLHQRFGGLQRVSSAFMRGHIELLIICLLHDGCVRYSEATQSQLVIESRY